MDLVSLLSVGVALVIALCGYLFLADDLPRLRKSGAPRRRR